MSFSICLFTKHYYGDGIEESEMGRVCSTHGLINVCKILIEQFEGRNDFWDLGV
jgi:hypothetical protein